MASSARWRVGYRPTRTRYGARSPATRTAYPRAASRFDSASASARASNAATCTLYWRVPAAGGALVARGVVFARAEAVSAPGTGGVAAAPGVTVAADVSRAPERAAAFAQRGP